MAPVKRPGKYRNVRGGGFDSKKEAKRHAELLLLLAAGAISDLRRQTRWELIPSQRVAGKVVERPAFYTCDFAYLEGGELVVEDVKSPATRTQAYVLRRKLMLWRYGLKVREV